jgi:hypothetical protein
MKSQTNASSVRPSVRPFADPRTHTRTPGHPDGRTTVVVLARRARRNADVVRAPVPSRHPCACGRDSRLDFHNRAFSSIDPFASIGTFTDRVGFGVRVSFTRVLKSVKKIPDLFFKRRMMTRRFGNGGSEERFVLVDVSMGKQCSYG